MSHRFHSAHHLRLATCIAIMIVLGGLMLVPQRYVLAATLSVTTTVDELNSDGDCSLREAIRAANLNSAVDMCPAGGSTDTIVLSAATYTLALSGPDENNAATGDLDLSANMTIQGAASGTTILDGASLDRVLEVRSPATVTLTSLLILNGQPPAGQRGGGIFNAGTLTIANSTVRENKIDGGPGEDDAKGGGIANDGTLTLTNVTVAGNRAGSPEQGECDIGSGFGGGIYNNGTLIATDSQLSGNTAVVQDECGNIGFAGGLYNDSGRSATLTRVAVRNNGVTTSGYGGGIANFGEMSLTDVMIEHNGVSGGYGGGYGGGISNGSTGTLHLIRTTVSENGTGGRTGGDGGGIGNQGTLSISDSTISDNNAEGGITSGGGGGIATSGTLTMTRTRVTGNIAGGGYMAGGGFGGGIANAGSASITRSAIWNNTAKGGAEESVEGGRGGGIATNGDLTLTNSTVSGNTAEASINTDDTNTVDGGEGGGIWNSDALTLANSTIANNVAGSGFDEGSGGGVLTTGLATIRNTILAGNTAAGQGIDCAGSIGSQGYNLIGSSAGCTITGVTTGNLLGSAAGLGPLQDNGGGTETHALQPGSPALDAAHPQAPGSGGAACDAIDQRGVSRPQDGDASGSARCDMGAYERQPAASQITRRGYFPLALR